MSKPKKEERAPENERILAGLVMGSVKPKNKKEEKLLEQVKEIQAKGLMVDIPFDI